MENWSNLELCGWLEKKGLDDEFVQIFKQHGINGAQFLALTQESLVEMGVKFGLVRQTIVQWIEELKPSSISEAIPISSNLTDFLRKSSSTTQQHGTPPMRSPVFDTASSQSDDLLSLNASYIVQLEEFVSSIDETLEGALPVLSKLEATKDANEVMVRELIAVLREQLNQVELSSIRRLEALNSVTSSSLQQDIDAAKRVKEGALHLVSVLKETGSQPVTEESKFSFLENHTRAHNMITTGVKFDIVQTPSLTIEPSKLQQLTKLFDELVSFSEGEVLMWWKPLKSTQIFAIGGDCNGSTTNSVESFTILDSGSDENPPGANFNPFSPKIAFHPWVADSPMLTHRRSFAISSNNKAIYIAGGRSDVKRLNSAAVLDLATRQWSALPPMKWVRSGSSATLMNDRYFVVTGGRNDMEHHTTCEMLDIETKVWADLPNEMATRRSQHATVYYRNRVVVIGGETASVAAAIPDLSVIQTGLTFCEQYDPTLRIWFKFPELVHARFAFGCAVHEDQIYAVGGDTEQARDTVEIYDGVKWMLMSNPLPRARWACAAVSFNGLLVLIGGFGKDGEQNSIETYNRKLDKWSTLVPPLMNRRSYFSAASI